LIGSYAHAKKTGLENGLAEVTKAPRKPAATGNKRLSDQTRKILGKHYASKYRG